MPHSSSRPAEPLSEAAVLSGALFFGLLFLVLVAVPSVQSFPVGARVQVLIDLQDPGYAEMAGQ